MSVLSVYNDLMINKEKRIVMFGYNRHCNLLIDSIIDNYTYNFLPGHIVNVNYTNIITIRDPIDNKIIYTKGSRLTQDFFRQCVDNICIIYVFLKITHKYSTKQIIDLFLEITFQIETEKGVEKNELF